MSASVSPRAPQNLIWGLRRLNSLSNEQTLDTLTRQLPVEVGDGREDENLRKEAALLMREESTLADVNPHMTQGQVQMTDPVKEDPRIDGEVGAHQVVDPLMILMMTTMKMSQNPTTLLNQRRKRSRRATGEGASESAGGVVDTHEASALAGQPTPPATIAVVRIMRQGAVDVGGIWTSALIVILQLTALRSAGRRMEHSVGPVSSQYTVMLRIVRLLSLKLITATSTTCTRMSRKCPGHNTRPESD